MKGNSDFFSHSTCFSCKTRLMHPIKRCAQCKVVAYCSKEHQLLEWDSHKALCKVIASENNYIQYKVKSHTDLVRYIQQRGLLWQLKLGRKLLKAEAQMFMFPRVCAVCFKREILVDCEQCSSAFYCSNEHYLRHQEKHQKFCKLFRLSSDMDCYFFRNIPVEAFTLKAPNPNQQTIPESLEFLNYVTNRHLSTTDLNYINSCDEILSGLTVLFALNQSGILKNRQLAKPFLGIHIVGATALEYSLNWALTIEIFFHWILNLQVFSVAFIGPEAPDLPIDFQNIQRQFCENCRKRTNFITAEAKCYPSLYHEVADHLIQPDIVVAFNSGLHEFYESSYDPWKSSVKCLIQNAGVPLLLTAYTLQEIRKDLQIIQETAQVKVLHEPRENPFRNQRPLQDWASQDDPIYFINNYLAIAVK
ncbi:hypothetical protein HUJ04_002534 [Dendroctonus ponderosae]|nr:hypothetical protein HUJ04_002534 [Dendroctonus ponderosae]